jgi:transposase
MRRGFECGRRENGNNMPGRGGRKDFGSLTGSGPSWSRSCRNMRTWDAPGSTDSLVLDAILHLLRTGCPWSALPDWAPPRRAAYDWVRRLADAGWLDRLHHVLLMAVREYQGREASPTLGIIDSQTVKVMAPAGPRGYDAAKKINGRKRHILVDSRGNLLAVHVTDAAVQDRDGGIDLVRQVRALYPWIVRMAADGSYAGRFQKALERLRITVEIVRRPDFANSTRCRPRPEPPARTGPHRLPCQSSRILPTPLTTTGFPDRGMYDAGNLPDQVRSPAGAARPVSRSRGEVLDARSN